MKYKYRSNIASELGTEIKILFGALVLLFSGCATYEPLSSDEFHSPIGKVERDCTVSAQVEAETISLKHHVLESGSDGDLADDRFKDSFNKAFRTIMKGYADAVKKSEGEGTERPRLLFYFNGGLNAQGDVEQQAKQQIPCMIADGYYPIFFIWDTAGLATYREQVTKIYDGHRNSAWWRPWLAPLQVGGDVLLGIGHAPEDYVLHGRRFWRALSRKPPCYLVVQTKEIDGVECDEAQHVSFVDNQSETALGPITHDRQVVIDERRDKVDQSQTEVGRFVQYSALLPARLVSTPFAHGLGAAAWENMLRRTRTTVRRSIEYYLDRHGYRDMDGDELIDVASGCPNDFREKQDAFKQGTGVFAMFFEMLKRHHQKSMLPPNGWICEGDSERRTQPSDIAEGAAQDDVDITNALQDAEITMIGHSMGAIVINELLPRFPDLPYSDIVYMAAAASVQDTRAALDGYFSQNTEVTRNARFYSLMLHPLNDTRERQYAGAVPSGSLLMWIDEMYEVPKVPDDKTFGFWPNAKSSRGYFNRYAKKQMLYRIFNRPTPFSNEPANPMVHGDFNNDETCFWRPAFWGVRNTEWQSRYESTMPKQALDECTAEGPSPS